MGLHSKHFIYDLFSTPQEAEIACENAQATLKVVRAAYKTKTDAEQQIKDKTTMPTSEHTKKYEEMKAAVFDTQKLVEVRIVCENSV